MLFKQKRPSYRGIIHVLHRLVAGNARERRYLLYFLGMTIRGIDLRGVGIDTLGLTKDRANWYSNSGGPELDRVFRSLRISTTDAALDIGCGKGGAMLTMAKYPFARIDGVEISPALVSIAQKNIGRAKIRNARVFCCDAADFKNFDEYTILYMYNPFPENVLRVVLDNISLSFVQRKRRLILIYKNPVGHGLITQRGFCKVAEFTDTEFPYYIYALE
jgi:SAM-dependent methyltransferase